MPSAKTTKSPVDSLIRKDAIIARTDSRAQGVRELRDFQIRQRVLTLGRLRWHGVYRDRLLRDGT